MLEADPRTVLLALDCGLYPRPAVLAAAGLFADRAEFRVAAARANSRVQIRALPAMAAADLKLLALEFLNEALNQSVRQLASKADKATPLIYARAMLSALGGGRPPLPLDAAAAARAEELLRRARAEREEAL